MNINKLRKLAEAATPGQLVNRQVDIWDGVVQKVVPEALAKYKEFVKKEES